MKEIKVGESFSGDELVDSLGGETNERFYAVANNEKIIVAEDEGNDNYKVVAIVNY